MLFRSNKLESLCFPDRLGPFSQNDQEMDTFASLQVVASWFLLSFSALALVASSSVLVYLCYISDKCIISDETLVI